MKRTLRGDLREMNQGKLGSKVHLGNTLTPLVPIYMEESWWRDPGGGAGSEKAHGSTPNFWTRTFIYLFFLMHVKSLLSLCYKPGTVLGAAYTEMSTTDLIPALMEFTVYQKRLTLHKLLQLG